MNAALVIKQSPSLRMGILTKRDAWWQTITNEIILSKQISGVLSSLITMFERMFERKLLKQLCDEDKKKNYLIAQINIVWHSIKAVSERKYVKIFLLAWASEVINTFEVLTCWADKLVAWQIASNFWCCHKSQQRSSHMYFMCFWWRHLESICEADWGRSSSSKCGSSRK